MAGSCSTPGSASTACAKPVASSPQNRSPPIASVGTPNTPAAIAAAVSSRSRALTAGAAIAAAGSAIPSARAGAASACALSPARPSAQSQSNSVVTAFAQAVLADPGVLHDPAMQRLAALPEGATRVFPDPR